MTMSILQGDNNNEMKKHTKKPTSISIAKNRRFVNHKHRLINVVVSIAIAKSRRLIGCIIYVIKVFHKSMK